MESATLNDSLTANTIEFRLSRDDALLINNSLNEVCYGFKLEPKEFETRIGAKRESVIELLKTISSEINQFTKKDETDYLLKSPRNARQLERAKKNEATSVSESKRPKIDINELLAGITPENRHKEVDWGKPEGREVW